MIDYRTDCEGLVAAQLEGFFVGWPSPPSAETHLRLLRNSDRLVLAIDTEMGRVVGFSTALTDGVLSSYIPLLEVIPEYQGRGIGTELVRRLLAQLDNLYMVDVLCDPDLEAFYSRIGMVPGHAMMLRRYEHQSGSG